MKNMFPTDYVLSLIFMLVIHYTHKYYAQEIYE